MSIREEVVEYLLENGDKTKRELAKKFDITTYEALEAKKRAEFERCWRHLGPSIAYFDLETTDLKPEFGLILCCAVLTYPSGEWNVFSILDEERNEDGELVDIQTAVEIRDCLEQHDIIVGWNSKGFDVPFLNTRLDLRGERKLHTHLHIDPMYCYRGWHGVKPSSSSLKSVLEFYDAPFQKLEIPKKVWQSAKNGSRNAIKKLVDRSKSDVEGTAWVTSRAFKAGLIKNIGRYA